MLYNRLKRVDFSRDLPGDIHSAFLRHTVSVEFEQHWMAPSQRIEPSFDQLCDWCNNNCNGLFTASKWAQNAAHFRFYLEQDLHSFEQQLAITVANPAASVS